MSTDTKKSILFIEDTTSKFNSDSKMFDELFAKVEKVSDEQKALKLIYKNHYDIIIIDISVEPLDGITFMKQIKEIRPEQEIVTLVSTEDESKIGDLIEGGIHAFLLTPDQFDQALETVAQMHSTPKS